MNRLVALKVLHKQWISDDEFRKRFVLEARIVGKLSHQNLIQVYDVGKGATATTSRWSTWRATPLS